MNDILEDFDDFDEFDIVKSISNNIINNYTEECNEYNIEVDNYNIKYYFIENKNQNTFIHIGNACIILNDNNLNSIIINFYVHNKDRRNIIKFIKSDEYNRIMYHELGHKFHHELINNRFSSINKKMKHKLNLFINKYISDDLIKIITNNKILISYEDNIQQIMKNIFNEHTSIKSIIFSDYIKHMVYYLSHSEKLQKYILLKIQTMINF